MKSDQEFQTSAQLQALETEIETTEARLRELKEERGAAVAARAAGTEGADQRLTDAHAETDRLERQLTDARDAHNHETRRLDALHREAVAAKQDERRQQIEAARKQVVKVAGKADKAVDGLLAALSELEQAGSGLARVHCRGAGNSVTREALAVIQERLNEHSSGNPDAGKRATDRMPDADVVVTAAIPDTLDDLNAS